MEKIWFLSNNYLYLLKSQIQFKWSDFPHKAGHFICMLYDSPEGKHAFINVYFYFLLSFYLFYFFLFNVTYTSLKKKQETHIRI